MKAIKVLIADDHPMVLEGFATILSSRDPEIKVVATAADGRDAVEKESRYNPDVSLLDIKMPGMSGIEAAGLIKKRNSNAKIIMLTTFDDRELIQDALRAGAKGYLLKDAPVLDVIEAIKTVYKGNALMSAHVLEQLTGDKRDHGAGEDAMTSEGDSAGVSDLAPREREVLALIALGKDNRQIAEELHISVKTVRNYVVKIYDIVGIHTRTQLALWALEHRLITK